MGAAIAVPEVPQITTRRTITIRAIAARRAARDAVASGAAPTLEMDEATLIHQARDGSREAFGQLYERHRATIARYVTARIRDPSDSEDLTEAIFESAWRAM